MRERSLLATVALVVGAAILAVGLVGTRLMQTRPQEVAHAQEGLAFAIDAKPWNNANPCASIDATDTVNVGVTHEVAVCVVNPPEKPGEPGLDDIDAFLFTLTYDPDLNECKQPDPDCAEDPSGKCLDDNPDANAGDTLGSGSPTSPDLGSGWDCSGVTQPTCADGQATMNCYSMSGPYTSGGLDPFPLAIVSFTAIGQGVDTISTHDNIWTGADTGEWYPESVSAEVQNEGPLAPVGVGGMQELPDVAGSPRSGEGPSSLPYAVVGAAAVVAVTAGGWYARRRWRAG